MPGPSYDPLSPYRPSNSNALDATQCRYAIEFTFIEADANKSWPFKQFSFQGRMLTSGIRDWFTFLARCWEYLEPRGVLELLDICHPFRAEDAATNEVSSVFIRFGYRAEKSWASNGLDYGASAKNIERLKSLGFVNVGEEEKRWPLGQWAETGWEK